MDKSIFTALNSMQILRNNQSVSAQNLSNTNVPGFKKFNLVKGDVKDDHTLYASHSLWESKKDFIN